MSKAGTTIRSGMRPIEGKWEPIETAPLDTPILVTDFKSMYLATFVRNLVFSGAPQPSQNHGIGQAAANFSISKPFSPTHWHAAPKTPVQP